MAEIIQRTPTVEELMPYYKFNCDQPGCRITFTNRGSFGWHLQRHHKMSPSLINLETMYYCPTERCLYNVGSVTGRSFRNLKYLRQHFHKVHLAKTQHCDKCNKFFVKVEQLEAHNIKGECGRKYECSECGWEYDSKEALQTHAKRKFHVQKFPLEVGTSELQKRPIPRLRVKQRIGPTSKNNICINKPKMATKANTSCKTNEMWTEIPKNTISKITAINITPFTYGANVITTTANDLDEINSLLRDIETQTEMTLNQATSSTNTSEKDLIEQILANPSIHTCTQTPVDLLSEFGLADTQTQTNWSHLEQTKKHDKPTEHPQNLLQSSTSIASGFAHDAFLVTTETQTSYTQSLLDSNTIKSDAVTTSNSNVDGDTGFCLYNTQYTQTCDMLLNDIFGGEQGNDLITSFQSTYTQT